MYRPRWGVELRDRVLTQVSRCEVPGPIMPQLIKMITFSESINFSQDKKKKKPSRLTLSITLWTNPWRLFISGDNPEECSGSQVLRPQGSKCNTAFLRLQLATAQGNPGKKSWHKPRK